MEKKKAKALFRIAIGFVPPEELEWVRNLSPGTFKKMNSKEFLREYCWVVYVAGFKEKILREKFDDLEKAFKYFDIEKLYTMGSIEKVLAVFNNERKARNFLEGVKLIYRESFSTFKKRY